MKRFALTIILALSLCCSLQAQYANINIDSKTIAAMELAFETEAQMEAIHNKNLLKIMESYQAAELATAGIFAVKHFDRKALTDLDLWSSDENYYYKSIYKLVGERIIPKTIDVAKLMVKDPSTAIYWGSYLVKTTDEVKSLCQQFESVVTNSTLSFKDLPFLEISEDFKKVFNITKLGDVDWKVTFEQIGSDIENSFTKDNLKNDLDVLIGKGINLATSGFNSGLQELLKGTSFGGSFQEKIGDLITLAGNAKDMYDDVKDKSALAVAEKFAGSENISNLFNLSDYNLGKWADDFTSSSKGEFYTQRVYIYRKEKGTEQLCNYIAPRDEHSIMNSGHWAVFPSFKDTFTPDATQQEKILQNSESHAGWSRQKVEQLNKENAGKGYTYDIKYSLNGYTIVHKYAPIKVYYKAYAYDIQVYKHTDITEIVYEEIFDSYKMDWNTFMALMNARLEQYNMNGDHTDINNPGDITLRPEKNYTYHIGYDDPRYYQATTEKELKGACSATFTLTCHDGGTLGKGSTSYKCRDCGKSVTEHTKQCSMKSSLSNAEDIDSEIKQLKQEIQAKQSEAAVIQSTLDKLNKENSELRRKMSTASSQEEYEKYRKQFEANQTIISQKQSRLDELNRSIAELNQALIEAEEGEKVQTDDYNRIPQIMKYMKDAYQISWADEGAWNGDTFVRNGNIANGSTIGAVKFSATIKIARKPKYFLGVKIHRAIVQIDWELTSSWSDSSIAEEMELDPSLSDAQKADLINNKLSELAQQHPDCEVSVETFSSPGHKIEDKEGVKHLLWASDRLEIARDIQARLIKIYTELVFIEKFMHYKYGINDWIKRLIPKLNADKDRKMNIAEQCHKRWMLNAGINESN